MSTSVGGTYGKRLEARFDTAGWGLLFLLVAALALPHGTAEYASVAVVGGLMAGLNLLRAGFGVAVRWLSLILGTAMAIAGGGALLGVRMDAFVLFFALAGVVNIADALWRRERPQTA
jgi:hypothetical protein